MCRQVAATSAHVLQHRAGVWIVHAAGELTTRLHHLPTRVMHRCGRVIAGADDRKLVGDLGMLGQDLGELKIAFGRDRFERPTDFRRSLGLHVKRVQLAGGTQIENHDARSLVLGRINTTMFGRGQVLGQAQSDGAERTNLQEVATRSAIARVRRATRCQIQH